MIRILLIEDLAVVRQSLAVALSATTDIEAVCCASIEEGMAILKGQPGQFDVVLLKQAVGSEKGDELLSVANEAGLKGKVVIITPWLSDQERSRLASLGVADIFAKQRSLTELVGCIRDVASGQTWFYKPQERSAGRRSGALACQERRTAALVFEGLSNKEIGRRLGVSESCIKGVLRRVFLKMGVQSRGQLIRALSEKATQGPSELAMAQPEVLSALSQRCDVSFRTAGSVAMTDIQIQ